MSKQIEERSIDDIAAQWVVRVDAGELLASERDALNLWLAQDERHYGAFARARSIYLGFDQLASFKTSDHRELPAPAMLNRRRLLMLGGGALAAGVAGMGFFALRSPREYSTRIGEIRRVPLPDGSAMTLNTQTHLSISFNSMMREIRLLRGEVLFEVAVDPLRLFTVDSFSTRVTAAAAAFTVRALSSDSVQVVVRNGQVRVSDPSRGTDVVTLQANTFVQPRTATARGGTATAFVPERLEPVEVERRLAWQRGQLSFEDVPLDEALREFSRYSDTRIVLDSPDIGSLKVVGLFSASDPVGFARTVAISLGLKVGVRDGVTHLAGT